MDRVFLQITLVKPSHSMDEYFHPPVSFLIRPHTLKPLTASSCQPRTKDVRHLLTPQLKDQAVFRLRCALDQLGSRLFLPDLLMLPWTFLVSTENHDLPSLPSFWNDWTFSPVSVLKQYEQPVQHKELTSQVMWKASRTVPDGGEMLHEGGRGSVGVVGSGPGTGKMYLAKPGWLFPARKKNLTLIIWFYLRQTDKMKTDRKQSQWCCWMFLLKLSEVDCGPHIQHRLPVCPHEALFLRQCHISPGHPRGKHQVLSGVYIFSVHC